MRTEGHPNADLSLIAVVLCSAYLLWQIWEADLID